MTITQLLPIPPKSTIYFLNFIMTTLYYPVIIIIGHKNTNFYCNPVIFVGRGQHSSNRVSGISTRTMHQSTTPSLSQTIWPRWASRQFLTLPIVQTLLPVTYSLSSEAVVMRQLRRWKRLWRRSLTRLHKRTSIMPSRSCWNGTTSALQPGKITPEGIEFHVCIINKSAHTKKVWKLI